MATNCGPPTPPPLLPSLPTPGACTLLGPSDKGGLVLHLHPHICVCVCGCDRVELRPVGLPHDMRTTRPSSAAQDAAAAAADAAQVGGPGSDDDQGMGGDKLARADDKAAGLLGQLQTDLRGSNR
jgi:hypothetical protein